MTYVVTENCIKCKFTDCVDVCPVDCFHEGPNFLVIDPEECIDCTLCVPECPAEAIFAEDDVPEEQRRFIAINAELAKEWPVIVERMEPLADADDGHFKFEGLPVGADITLVMQHPDYHPIQMGTHELPDEGLTRITFQAVTPAIYGALAAIVGVTPDVERYCQMVTTVTRVGKSIYDMGAHGEAEVIVTLEPPLPHDASSPSAVSHVMYPPGTHTGATVVVKRGGTLGLVIGVLGLAAALAAVLFLIYGPHRKTTVVNVQVR